MKKLLFFLIFLNFFSFNSLAYNESSYNGDINGSYSGSEKGTITGNIAGTIKHGTVTFLGTGNINLSTAIDNTIVFVSTNALLSNVTGSKSSSDFTFTSIGNRYRTYDVSLSSKPSLGLIYIAFHKETGATFYVGSNSYSSTIYEPMASSFGNTNGSFTFSGTSQQNDDTLSGTISGSYSGTESGNLSATESGNVDLNSGSIVYPPSFPKSTGLSYSNTINDFYCSTITATSSGVTISSGEDYAILPVKFTYSFQSKSGATALPAGSYFAPFFRAGSASYTGTFPSVLTNGFSFVTNVMSNTTPYNVTAFNIRNNSSYNFFLYFDTGGAGLSNLVFTVFYCVTEDVSSFTYSASLDTNTSNYLFVSDLTSIDDNLDKVNNNLGVLDKDLGKVNDNLGVLDKDLGKVNDNLGVLDKDLGVIDKDIQNTNSRLDTIINYIEANKVMGYQDSFPTSTGMSYSKALSGIYGQSINFKSDGITLSPYQFYGILPVTYTFTFNQETGFTLPSGSYYVPMFIGGTSSSTGTAPNIDLFDARYANLVDVYSNDIGFNITALNFRNRSHYTFDIYFDCHEKKDFYSLSFTAYYLVTKSFASFDFTRTIPTTSRSAIIFMSDNTSILNNLMNAYGSNDAFNDQNKEVSSALSDYKNMTDTSAQYAKIPDTLFVPDVSVFTQLVPTISLFSSVITGLFSHMGDLAVPLTMFLVFVFISSVLGIHAFVVSSNDRMDTKVHRENNSNKKGKG